MANGKVKASASERGLEPLKWILLGGSLNIRDSVAVFAGLERMARQGSMGFPDVLPAASRQTKTSRVHVFPTGLSHTEGNTAQDKPWLSGWDQHRPTARRGPDSAEHKQHSQEPGWFRPHRQASPRCRGGRDTPPENPRRHCMGIPSTSNVHPDRKSRMLENTHGEGWERAFRVSQ